MSSSTGFDAGGTDPICWTAAATPISQTEEENDSNVWVLADSSFSSSSDGHGYALVGPIQEQSACPLGTLVSVTIPNEQERLASPPRGWVVRWKEAFTVQVTARIDFQEWPGGDTRVADEEVTIAVLLCPVGVASSSCSPFVPWTATSWQRPQHPIIKSQPIPATTSDSTDMDMFSYTADFSFENAPDGTYSIVASVVFVTHNTTTAQSYQFASAANIPSSPDDRLVTFSESPEPLDVSDAARDAVIALSTLGGLILLYLLYQTLRHCKAQVFQLTQGKFLIAMLIAGLVATCSLFTLEARNDMYCQVSGPLIMLTIHVMFSILLGRLWRIRAVMSPLLLLTLEKKEHWTSKLVNWISSLTSIHLLPCCQSKPKKIRRAISDWQLAKVIIGLVLPQAIAQLFILVFQDNHVTIHFVGLDHSVGVQVCRYNFYNSYWNLASVLVTVILFILLAILAQASRDMPSLFNETKVFLEVTWLSFFALGVSAIVIISTAKQAVSPNIRFVTSSFAFVLVTVSTCVKVMLPKLKVIWRGDTILVTKLIADHHKKRKKGPLVVNENGCSTSPVATFFRSLNMSSHTDASKTGGDRRTNLDAVGGAGNSNHQPTNDRFDDDDKSTSSDNSSVVLLSEVHVHQPSPRRSTLTSLAGEEPPFRLSMIGMTVARRFSGAADNADNSTDSGLDIACDMTTEESVNLEEPTMKVVAPPSSTFNDLRRKNAFNDPRWRKTASKRSLVQWNDVDHRGSFSNLTKSDAPPDTRPPVRASLRNPRTSLVSIDRVLTKSKSARFSPSRVSAFFGGGSLKAQRHAPPPIEIGYNPKLDYEIVTISEAEPPGRRLLLRMLAVQRLLSKANKRILTGLSVDRDDWEELRDVCKALGEAFVNDVRFAWEIPPESPVAASAICEGEDETEDFTESETGADMKKTYRELNDPENGSGGFRSPSPGLSVASGKKEASRRSCDDPEDLSRVPSPPSWAGDDSHGFQPLEKG
jgi:hypothetical protein